jgi:C-terminal processing protease CtpA/Prc
MKYSILLFSLLVSNLLYSQSKYQEDFREFWDNVNNNYAYLKEQQIDWLKVRVIYGPQVARVKNDNEFIILLESLINELYNGHSSLNTNLPTSNRLVPSGQDMYVEKINGEFVITDLRKNYGAERAGLKVGHKIARFNDADIEPQLNRFLPKFTSNYNRGMYQYAIDMLFAGTHDAKRKIAVYENGSLKTYYPDSLPTEEPVGLVETKILDKNTAYIKINNCLFNNQLIGQFDKFVDSIIGFKNIVIDLSETPSGGNTTVARSIMGRFITKTLPYQKHRVDEGEYQTMRLWTEYVVPRKKIFKGNVYIIAGHWTGSMGEGIVIGFDALKRATIVGTRMGRLLGAVDNFQLTQTKIGYQFPTEKLYHINGTRRENFVPTVLTHNIYETDRFINKIK